MGVRRGKSKPAQVLPRPGALTGPTGERLTVLVLSLIAGFLAFVYFGVLPNQVSGRRVEFDFVNPMLRAEPGDCVGAQSSDDVGTEMCMVVRRRVERPARGPDILPDGYADLRRTLPYLVLDLHQASGTVSGCTGGQSQITLRALNNFGVDPDSQVAVERIVPVWAKWGGGKEGILYEVTMRRFDTERTYVEFISPDMPVTGLVKQEIISRRAPPQRAFFHEIDCGE